MDSEAFCGEERAAAFTSSEPFPSTFQIMRERNPPFRSTRESVSVRIMRLAAHARPPPPLSLSLFLSLPSCREHVAATVLPERRDPNNEIGFPKQAAT